MRLFLAGVAICGIVAVISGTALTYYGDHHQTLGWWQGLAVQCGIGWPFIYFGRWWQRWDNRNAARRTPAHGSFRAGLTAGREAGRR